MQSQQPSSLFGNLSQPQQSGGLFGSSNQAGSDQQQQGSSIFGGVSTHETGGLFGSQQSKNQIGGGLFGSSNAQPSQPQQGGGLFGSLGQNQPQNQSQQAQSSLFGGFNGQNKTLSPLWVLPKPAISLDDLANAHSAEIHQINNRTSSKLQCNNDLFLGCHKSANRCNSRWCLGLS